MEKIYANGDNMDIKCICIFILFIKFYDCLYKVCKILFLIDKI